MKIQTVVLGSFLVLNLAGCTSAAEKKDEAAAEYTEEKTETLKEYKDCVKASEGIEAKMAQCEALLKAVGAVEGGTVVSTPAKDSAPAEDSTPAEDGTPTESQ